jgi:hypothetical protein
VILLFGRHEPAAGITPAGTCDDCGRVRDYGAIRVVVQPERWSAMAWDRGYVTCSDCVDAPGTAVTEDEVVAIAAATWQIRQQYGGDWTAEFPAMPTLAEELRLAYAVLGVLEPADAATLDRAYAALRDAVAPPDGDEPL